MRILKFNKIASLVSSPKITQTINDPIRNVVLRITGKEITRVLFFVLLSGTGMSLMQCKSSSDLAAASLKPYLIACDTITVDDSSFYQPVFFKIKPKVIVHTYYNEDYYFDVLEKNSSFTSAKVVCSCNDTVYDLTMKIEDGGYLNFYQPKKTTRFRILRVVKSKS